MLKSIECDKFPESHRIITFSPGLNSIIGTEKGSTAIGKSTFLRIIDFVFGGSCYLKEEEILREIGHHEIYFSFQFGTNAPLYYCRKTKDPDNVINCDSEGHVIETLPIHKYQRTLMDEYNASRPGISLSDISDHFFRIYRRLNVLEQYPLCARPGEQSETTVNFLFKLFRHADILNDIQTLAKELHIDVSSVRSSVDEQLAPNDDIENIQQTISSLRDRLSKKMEENETAQTQLFGYNPRELEEAGKIRKELAQLAEQKSRLQSRYDAIIRNMDISNSDSAEDFEDLQTFFPNADMRKFEAIDSFHKKIREILLGELEKEKEHLESLIKKCDHEIDMMQTRLKQSGTAKKMSSQLVTECARLMNTIDKYEADLNKLKEDRERQKERIAAKNQIRELLRKEKEIAGSIEDDLNSSMEAINTFICGDSERAPSLKITANKGYTFGVPGNSSEGAAFRSMIVYDLAIIKTCGIPALIHDSNILKRIEDRQLDLLLDSYQSCGQQVFVAYDRLSAATDSARKKLIDCAALKLSEDDLLFGKAWSKNKTGGKA